MVSFHSKSGISCSLDVNAMAFECENCIFCRFPISPLTFPWHVDLYTSSFKPAVKKMLLVSAFTYCKFLICTIFLNHLNQCDGKRHPIDEHYHEAQSYHNHHNVSLSQFVTLIFVGKKHNYVMDQEYRSSSCTFCYISFFLPGN